MLRVTGSFDISQGCGNTTTASSTRRPLFYSLTTVFLLSYFSFLSLSFILILIFTFTLIFIFIFISFSIFFYNLQNLFIS